ncbi:hypothetical protein HYW83_00465 [Candidatus Peregrinibacteria bacterium]|nr:hypothetical protein [Candidatus Peregrinibacteria bacterium]
MFSLNKSLKIVSFAVYFILLVGISGKLFFEKQFDAFIETISSLKTEKSHSLTIAYADSFAALNPLLNDTGSRSRLLHIYDGLVKIGTDLQIKPGLALSYGSIDDFTWEFRLRPSVKFHNGKPLTADDVIFSLAQAKENPASGVKDLASTIQAVNKIDDERIQLITDSPDPLLLQKLSSFLIFQKDSNPADQSLSIGTGPYKAEKNSQGTVELARFEDYWGEKPVFERVVLQTLAKRDEKISALKNRSVDILANLPADIANNFQYRGYQLASAASLEVNFLMFNFDRVFRSRDLRQAVKLMLNTAQLGRLAQGFSVPATQFVGDGIFGYNPQITLPSRDPVKASELVKKVSGVQPVRVNLDLPRGLEVFGENVSEQLKKINMEVTPQFYPPDQLGQRITNRSSEFFFFGWRSELGDASDFLTAVVHSPSGNFGQFNGGNYRNGEADRLIELSQETLVVDVRLEKLRTVMKKITEDDVIGIPLFSPEILSAVSKKLDFSPRVDGYVLAQEVKL